MGIHKVKVREIIQQIGYSMSGEYLEVDMEQFEIRVDNALTDLKACMKELIPQKVSNKINTKKYHSSKEYCLGYNDAIREINKRIDLAFEEE